MRKINLIVLILLVLLSAAAGLVKIMQVPAVMKYLQGAGLTANMVLAFGLAQLIGGIGLIFKRTRIPGALIVALMLFISTIILLMSGNIAFGLLLVIPMLMAVMVIVVNAKEFNL